MLVHRSFPGQFRWLLPELERLNLDVVFVCNEKTNWPSQKIKIIELKQAVAAEQIAETGNELSSATIEAGIKLMNAGWIPDVIYSHSGWGAWKIANIFPTAKLAIYVEWWYNKENIRYHHWTKKDIGDNEMIIPNLINSITAEGINRADITLCPTNWQKNQFPKRLQSKINIIGEGFPLQDFAASNKNTIDKVPHVTFISRGFEATRGIIELSTILDEIDSGIQISVISDFRPVYDDRSDWNNYAKELYNKIKAKDNVDISESKGYDEYLNLLRSSDLHLYLSRPFVLSWSFIESSLIGSKIISYDNCATFEKTHSNHINVKNLQQLVSVINSISDHSTLKQLRISNKNWLRAEELEDFRKQHCIKVHTRKLFKLLMG